MNKVISFTVVLTLTTFLNLQLQTIAQTNTSSYSSKAVEAVSVKPDSICKNCKLGNTFYVKKDQLANFEKKFSAKILALKNDIISDGNNKVQINYIEGSTLKDAETIYKNLIKMVGNVNVVTMKGNVVIEIIASTIDLKEAALKSLKPEKVHKNY